MSYNYFNNLNRTIQDKTTKAFYYGDVVAWENKKRKVLSTSYPRGKAIKSLEKVEGIDKHKLLADKIRRKAIVLLLSKT